MVSAGQSGADRSRATMPRSRRKVSSACVRVIFSGGARESHVANVARRASRRGPAGDKAEFDMQIPRHGFRPNPRPRLPRVPNIGWLRRECQATEEYTTRGLFARRPRSLPVFLRLRQPTRPPRRSAPLPIRRRPSKLAGNCFRLHRDPSNCFRIYRTAGKTWNELH